MTRRNLSFTLLFAILSAGATYPEKHPPLADHSGQIAAQYKDVARKIVQSVMAGNDAYAKLEALCLDVGHRLSGSRALEHAVHWAADTMKSNGQERVRLEKVMVPHWVRGRESAFMIKPHAKPMAMLGLGGSVGTPPGGVTAPVIVVPDEDGLNAAGEAVRGKIVLFNKAMPPYDPEHGAGYGQTVKYRVDGARLAAAKGAVAVLVRSVTAKSIYAPHTGNMHYGDAKRQIPAAAITVEDAEEIQRLTDRGTEVVVNLKMGAKLLPDAESANVIGELRGRTNPDEYVVIGGHIDSWDVGQGAEDDGGGIVIAMEAINVLRKLNLRPRRTIRVVCWTNEENGTRGAETYHKDHAAELPNHVAAIESDSGVFDPRGYTIDCKDETRRAIAVKQFGEIMSLLPESFGKLEAKPGGSGADVGPMKEDGVVLAGHRVDGAHYFDYHHTNADTIDKIDPTSLSKNVAVLAVTAYVLADMPNRVGALP